MLNKKQCVKSAKDKRYVYAAFSRQLLVDCDWTLSRPGLVQGVVPWVRGFSVGMKREVVCKCTRGQAKQVTQIQIFKK